MSKAICIGELVIDFVSTTTDRCLAECAGFTKAPGGAPANVAVGLSRVGIDSGFIGKVGDDPFGDSLRTTLEENGVDTSRLISGTGCRTTLAFVATRSDGMKDIICYRNPGADMLLTPDEIDETYLQSADLFHYGSVSLSHQPSRDATLKAIQCAKDAGAFLSYDPNLRLVLWDSPADAKRWIWEAMPYADVAKLAEEEWEFVTDTSDLQRGSERILDVGVDLVVVTRGEHGCYYNDGSNQGYVDGFQVDVVDPLGAGDGFVAAMLAKLMQTVGAGRQPLRLDENQLRNIMTYANAAGALSTQHIGCIPALPTASEIEAFLN
jgi:fructokinase